MKNLTKNHLNSLFLREENLQKGINLLFFANQNFTRQTDNFLDHHKLGRAHHRVLYFIFKCPEITPSKLQGILKIKKQSLSRVLKTLFKQKLLIQKVCPQDQRQRLLSLSAAGQQIAEKLVHLQQKQIAQAYRNTGARDVEGFQKVLWALIDQENHPFLEKY